MKIKRLSIIFENIVWKERERNPWFFFNLKCLIPDYWISVRVLFPSSNTKTKHRTRNTVCRAGTVVSEKAIFRKKNENKTNCYKFLPVNIIFEFWGEFSVLNWIDWNKIYLNWKRFLWNSKFLTLWSVIFSNESKRNQ